MSELAGPSVMERIEPVLGEIAGRAAETDSERRYPAENLAALGQAGLMGLLVPGAQGGLGGGLYDLALAGEALGGACASTAMVHLMHSCGAALLAAKATPEQGERWLRPAATGNAIATLGFSERGSGAHFYAPEISARRENGHFVVSGRKNVITSASQATLYPLLVNASGGDGLDIIVVTPDLAGVSFDGTWEGIGMAGNSSISVVLDDVKVPAENVVGAEGDGHGLVFGVVAPTFLVGLAAVNVGIARSALEDAAAHAVARTYPAGQSLAQVPAIQRYLGEMSVAVESARQLVRAAARAADAGEATALPLVMQAKIAATETAMAVTGTAMQVGGGRAYSRQVPLERHWRDARAGSVMAPTNDVLKEWLGKVLTGLPLF